MKVTGKITLDSSKNKAAELLQAQVKKFQQSNMLHLIIIPHFKISLFLVKGKNNVGDDKWLGTVMKSGTLTGIKI